MIAQCPDEREIWGLHSVREPQESVPGCGNKGVPMCGSVCVCVCRTYVTSWEHMDMPMQVCAFSCLGVWMRVHGSLSLVQQTCCPRNLSAGSDERRIFHTLQPQNNVSPNIDLGLLKGVMKNSYHALLHHHKTWHFRSNKYINKILEASPFLKNFMTALRAK